MFMKLWYVETTLYGRNGQMLDQPGCLVVEAKTEQEAGQKAEKLSIEKHNVSDAEWGIAEEIGQPELEALMEVLGDELIIEPGLFSGDDEEEVVIPPRPGDEDYSDFNDPPIS